ncbi:sensor histidine kinase [Anaerobacillus sp. MEB173]|uniref:sensor histidine kinase n=1 Tax=Anaerobacillus sp. MEB173 TaxID=3383345 RepID=UPI003F907E3D
MTLKKVLDEILDKTIDTVEQSKEQIFEIGEQSLNEYQQLEKELMAIRVQVAEVIEQTDKTEIQAKFARNRLAEVSRQFQNFSDDEVRAAYEQANDFQVKLAVLQQKEKQLRDQRDRIERRLVQLKETIDRAEALGSQISVVFNYLSGDLRQFGEIVEDAKEKQEFGLRILEAQEDERKRLSREIHDGPAQMMANVLIRSELIERTYREQGIDKALKEIRDLRIMVKSSLIEVRRIIYDLRPMALDDLGLVPTLIKYLKTVEEHSGIKIMFRNLGQDVRLPTKLEVAVFRFVQEAVQNALKHASPTEVQIKLEIQTTKVIALIKDNGKGFDPTIKKEDSFGLIGMKERIGVLKGDLTIDSTIDKGTLLMIQIPIHQ